MISEKANDLLNKFGSAQFDFMVWNTPDNLVARDKARQEISDCIAELEEFKLIVEGCGFEVITEPPVLNHPERKILKGHGTIYVPELPEPPEVK